jgi:2-polyprenyl-3-methyl-5-hydroxy-6-metoxy-1,4-benzoquinol methylase
MNSTKKSLPQNLEILRGQTQKDVNKIILQELLNKFNESSQKKALDLPCGNLEFLNHLHILFPNWQLEGFDLFPPATANNKVNFTQMDLSKTFTTAEEEKFDLITCISGIMMFGNTENFLSNCIKRLNTDGTIIITNDNPATIKDRLSYLFLGRFRIFDQFFDDHETLTQLVIIQDLTRMFRKNNIEIEKIIYCSFYPKDFLFLPFALAVYPFQMLYLLSRKTNMSLALKMSKYNFKQLFGRHYIIIGKKKGMQ